MYSTCKREKKMSAPTLKVGALISLERCITGEPQNHGEAHCLQFLQASQRVLSLYRQISLFDDTAALQKNHKVQETVLEIKKKFGKNAVLKGMNLQEHATTQERNRQIGGHKSGQ